MSFTITKKPSLTSTTSSADSTKPTSAETGSNLTAEQLKRMEENRLRALQLKQKSSNSLTSTSNQANNQPKINTLSSISSAPVASATTSNPTKINTLSSMSNQASSVGSGASSGGSSPPKGNQPISSNYGKCVFLEDESEPRFEIQIGYNKAVIDLFKTVGSKRYDPNSRRWSFAMKNYDELLLRIKQALNGTVKIEPLNRVAMAASKVAKFILIDRNHFEVQCDFFAELQDVFKTMETKKYDPATKRWSFNLKDYNGLVAKINAKFKRGEVTVMGLPRAVRETFKAQIEGKNPPRFDPNIDFEFIKKRIDLNISKSLLPFQIEGICFAIQQNGRILCADDMGLGKTIQGLAVASYYKNEWPLFIIGKF
jgi:hypothetical protein